MVPQPWRKQHRAEPLGLPFGDHLGTEKLGAGARAAQRDIGALDAYRTSGPLACVDEGGFANRA